MGHPALQPAHYQLRTAGSVEEVVGQALCDVAERSDRDQPKRVSNQRRKVHGNRGGDLVFRFRQLAHHREVESREGRFKDHLHVNPGSVADDRCASDQLIGMEKIGRRLASVWNSHVTAGQSSIEHVGPWRAFRVVGDRAGGVLGLG